MLWGCFSTVHMSIYCCSDQRILDLSRWFTDGLIPSAIAWLSFWQKLRMHLGCDISTLRSPAPSDQIPPDASRSGGMTPGSWWEQGNHLLGAFVWVDLPLGSCTLIMFFYHYFRQSGSIDTKQWLIQELNEWTNVLCLPLGVDRLLGWLHRLWDASLLLSTVSHIHRYVVYWNRTKFVVTQFPSATRNRALKPWALFH